eukprot:s511_g8.t1
MEEPLDYANAFRAGQVIESIRQGSLSDPQWHLLGPGTSCSLGGMIQNQSQRNHRAPTVIMNCSGLLAQLLATSRVFGQRTSWKSNHAGPRSTVPQEAPGSDEVSASSTT